MIDDNKKRKINPFAVLLFVLLVGSGILVLVGLEGLELIIMLITLLAIYVLSTVATMIIIILRRSFRKESLDTKQQMLSSVIKVILISALIPVLVGLVSALVFLASGFFNF